MPGAWYNRFSSAEVVIFVNSPVSELVQSIAAKNTVTLREYALEAQPVFMRTYHASTLRWPFIYNFFLVIKLLINSNDLDVTFLECSLQRLESDTSVCGW